MKYMVGKEFHTEFDNVTHSMRVLPSRARTKSKIRAIDFGILPIKCSHSSSQYKLSTKENRKRIERGLEDDIEEDRSLMGVNSRAPTFHM